MTVPLGILAAGAVLLAVVGTPAWPWFHHFIEGGVTPLAFGRLFALENLGLMLLSILLVGAGVTAGALLYGRAALRPAADDPLRQRFPRLYRALADRLYVDEFYEATFIRVHRFAGRAADTLDRRVWNGLVTAVAKFSVLLSGFSQTADRLLFNRGFDSGCRTLRESGGRLSRLHNGNIQTYLRVLAAGMVLLIVFFAWTA